MSGSAVHHRTLLELLAAAGAIYAFYRGFESWRSLRALQDTPTSRVRSAAQGYVELEGHGAMPPGLDTRAPLTRSACIWWSYKIETCRGRSRGWNLVDSGRSEALFFIDDSTGRCLIDPRGADVFADATTVWYGTTRWPEVRIPDGSGALGRAVDFMLRGNFRYTERRMSANVPLCAIGEFSTLGGAGAHNTAAESSELLNTWKKDQPDLLRRFDLNHDGMLDGAEWERARAMARGMIEAKQLHESPAEHTHLVSCPSDGRPFLLASGNFTRLPDRLKWRVAAAICAFLALIALLAWLFSSAT